jgi:transcriptional regulator with XRE-family HTH domain
MSAKPKFMPEPRGWTQEQVATRLGVSLSWFSENRETLYSAGLPRADKLTGRTDSKAVERWMDLRSGLIDQLAGAAPDFDPVLARVRERFGGQTRGN